MILFDTDVCLALLRGNSRILELYGSSSEEICVSEITAQELFMAANMSSSPIHNSNTTENFLLTVRILHPDLVVLKYAANVQYTLITRGDSRTYADILMYSLSKVHDAKLITMSSKRYCFT